MPAPILEPCADLGGHGPHFWYRDRDDLTGAMRWCNGRGILAAPLAEIWRLEEDSKPIPYTLTERARAELEGWAQ